MSIKVSNDPVKFGQGIREARVKSKMTQQQLATKAGLATGTVRRLEAGILENCHLETVGALALALDLSSVVRIGRYQFVLS